jgi:MFS family permease
MKLPEALAPLRHGVFARYMGGEAISMVGTWMQSFTQGWFLATLTSSATILGAINFTAGLPMLALTLAGGSAADRYDKRWLIQGALLVQVITAAAVGVLILTHHVAVWHMFVAAFLVGIATAFEVPAVSAFVPELVPRDQMANAMAIDRSVFHATRLVGPALGGALVEVFGFAMVYLINALSYVPLIAAVLTVPRRPIETAEEKALRSGSMRAGFDYVRADEPTRAMVFLIVAATLFISPFIVVLMPIYAHNTLGLEPKYGGILMGVTGIGSLIGSIGVLAIPNGRRAAALKAGATGVVLGMIALGTATSFMWAVCALIPLLMGLSTCFAVTNIAIQQRAPDELRGRISAVVALAFFGIIPFSGLLVSALADWIGVRTMMLAGAACYGCAAMWLLWGRTTITSAPKLAVGVAP